MSEPFKLPSTAKPLAQDAKTMTPVFLVEDVGTGVTLTFTRSEPWQLGSMPGRPGDWVVLVRGRTGGYLLERCFDATEIMGSLLGPQALGELLVR